MPVARWRHQHAVVGGGHWIRTAPEPIFNSLPYFNSSIISAI
jgi:hypothetical protein